MSEMLKAEYQQLTRPHTRALRQLLLDFDFFVADAGNLNVFSLSGRIKTHESALEKEQRLGVPIKDMQDLAGIRLVLATSDEVEVIAKFLQNAHDRKRFAIASDKLIRNSGGYAARHIILTVGYDITQSVFDATVEIQLQTILQHAYNFISRAWVYKSARDLSSDWQTRFQEVARTLATLDSTIAELHADVLEAASHGADAEPLTPFSFQRIVKEAFAEDVSLDEAVWHTRLLIDLHCTTNGETRQFFRDPAIVALHKRVANPKNERARAFLSGFATMPMYAFFASLGVRLEATHTLVDHLEDDAQDKAGA